MHRVHTHTNKLMYSIRFCSLHAFHITTKHDTSAFQLYTNQLKKTSYKDDSKSIHATYIGLMRDILLI